MDKTAAEIEAFLQKHATVDCRLGARITPEFCEYYQKNNWWLVCVGCPRCPPGELGNAAAWLHHLQMKFRIKKEAGAVVEPDQEP